MFFALSAFFPQVFFFASYNMKSIFT